LQETLIARIGLMSIPMPPAPIGGITRRKMFRYGSTTWWMKSTVARSHG